MKSLKSIFGKKGKNWKIDFLSYLWIRVYINGISNFYRKGQNWLCIGKKSILYFDFFYTFEFLKLIVFLFFEVFLHLIVSRNFQSQKDDF